MEVRNKLWEEFKQAKANVVCIRRYNSVQRQLNSIYQIFIAVCAAVGTFSFGFSDRIPFFALLSIAIVSLVKAIFPQIIQPEQELCELDGIMDYYNSFMNKMEVFFYQLDKDLKNDDEVIQELFVLKEDECNKKSKMNRLIRWIPKRMQKKVDAEVQTYIEEVYYNIYKQDEQQ
ncbi:MAG: hypothetical protein PUF00_09945 [Paraprevotella sp.]|nr:hypothetical protein [Paraprevotella sp.]